MYVPLTHFYPSIGGQYPELKRSSLALSESVDGLEVWLRHTPSHERDEKNHEAWASDPRRTSVIDGWDNIDQLEARPRRLLYAA